MCSTGCPTQDHATFGECLRAKGLQIDRHGLQNGSQEKDKERRLGRYEDARRAGLQPKSTGWKDVRNAFEHGGIRHTEVKAAADANS